MTVRGLAEVVSASWDARVEELTAPFRERRAKALGREASERRAVELALRRLPVDLGRDEREADLAAMREWNAKPRQVREAKSASAGVWHFQRARGHRERFERVRSCQTSTTVRIMCDACKDARERLGRCRLPLVCVSCRGTITNEKRAKLALARHRALKLSRRAGLMNPRRAGGAHSEKLVTLTMPTLSTLGVLGRIRFFADALKRFSPRLRKKWLSEHPDSAYVDDRGNALIRWARHVEWEPGEEDGLGHPHAHFWFLGPYIPNAGREQGPDPALRATDTARVSRGRIACPRRLPKGPATLSPIRAAWRWSLLMASKALPDDARVELLAKLGQDGPVVDVRRARPAREGEKRKSVVAEIVKYLFKDLQKGDERRIAPEIWAEVYEGHDGRRSTQASRGLMGLTKRHATRGHGSGAVCGKCGTPGRWRVRRDYVSEEMERRLRSVPSRRRREVFERQSGVPPMPVAATSRSQEGAA